MQVLSYKVYIERENLLKQEKPTRAGKNLSPL
jgi:hypothetical protein